MIMSEVAQRPPYPVVVMTRGEDPALARARLREVAGSVAEAWTYQPVEAGGWEGASTSGESQSSGSTRSTAASSPGLVGSLVRRGRVIENPLEQGMGQPLGTENIYQTIEPLLSRGEGEGGAHRPLLSRGEEEGGGKRFLINKHLDVVQLRQ